MILGSRAVVIVRSALEAVERQQLHLFTLHVTQDMDRHSPVVDELSELDAEPDRPGVEDHVASIMRHGTAAIHRQPARLRLQLVHRIAQVDAVCRLDELRVARAPDHFRQSAPYLLESPVQRVARGRLVQYQPLVPLLWPVVIVRLVVEAVESQQLVLLILADVPQDVDAHPLVREQVSVLYTELDRVLADNCVSTLFHILHLPLGMRPLYRFSAFSREESGFGVLCYNFHRKLKGSYPYPSRYSGPELNGLSPRHSGMFGKTAW